MFSFKCFVYLFVLHVAFGQTYSPLSYGAKGDGTTDDTSAVRAALAAATNSKGGRVLFDYGKTFLTGGFNVTNNTILDIKGTILGSTDNSKYIL